MSSRLIPPLKITKSLLRGDRLGYEYHTQGILVLLALDEAEADEVEHEQLPLREYPIIVRVVWVEPLQVFQLYTSSKTHKRLPRPQTGIRRAHNSYSAVRGRTIPAVVKIVRHLQSLSGWAGAYWSSLWPHSPSSAWPGGGTCPAAPSASTNTEWVNLCHDNRLPW